ncbi:MAG: glucose 1-dehydrogenase [Gammaproteobacteria bacterium]|nr:glucose 1-dehydrogenase [Gammaproteobacteria bacterium]NCW21543.1 glucose 1-dehydrogenase [Gammaproteobacteria bacterium]NDA43972.1 glucose 1-dehydrogenase [Gammaproteobacteria bacterium]NDB17021.1 glucose 1-dehydrogenase [Gammaproteobacteria bacterium]
MEIATRFRLDGKTALVTGAGRGIGRAIALALAAAGADVAVAARTRGDLDSLALEIRSHGRRALVLAGDVGRAADLESLVPRCTEELGRLDVLVNNAGGAGPNDPLRTTPEQFLKALEWNVLPAFALTRLAVPAMRATGGGSVINITSAAARYAQRSFSSYGTAKAALTQLTRLLAQDFAPHIRVNAIAPGPVVTEALGKYLTPEVREAMEKRTPLARLGTVDDIAAAALYLATPASSWMTGKTLELDGGAEATVWPL